MIGQGNHVKDASQFELIGYLLINQGDVLHEASSGARTDRHLYDDHILQLDLYRLLAIEFTKPRSKSFDCLQ
ncbi:hypothetical protein FRB94_013670 [Tulasnella sp. JGI-2019a]|nr:hypothetical protein FRB94_013670 [Tulasnella sp. JGI-2019a]